eukprot:Nk52_evm6s155 gene=Nk52_evmTU6s155
MNNPDQDEENGTRTPSEDVVDEKTNSKEDNKTEEEGEVEEQEITQEGGAGIRNTDKKSKEQEGDYSSRRTSAASSASSSGPTTAATSRNARRVSSHNAKASLAAASSTFGSTKDNEALATVAKRLTAAQPCKNECGFYGNPAQLGFCSVCYVNYQRNQYSAVAGASAETVTVRPEQQQQLQKEEGIGGQQHHRTAAAALKGARGNETNQQQQQRQGQRSDDGRQAVSASSSSSDAPRTVEVVVDGGEGAGNSNSNRFSQLIQEEATTQVERDQQKQQQQQQHGGVGGGQVDGSSSRGEQEEEGDAAVVPQDSSVLAEKLVQIARSSRVGDFLRRVETTLSSAFQAENDGEGIGGDGSESSLKQTYTFSDFLKAMREPAAQDLVVKTKKFIDDFQSGCNSGEGDAMGKTTPQMIEEVQSFLQGMADDIATHPLWRRSPEAEIENSIDGIEKYVMTKLYNNVFLPKDMDDGVKDEELAARISSFNWIVPRNLDIDISKDIDGVRYFLLAKKELNKVDSKRAPQDKLNCIVKCSKCLFHVLQLCEKMKGKAASADEFLPLLIYLVLKTNPVRLHSNIQYLSRYCNTRKMISGEAGYYFTNMCCAVEYISKLTEESLTMDVPEDTGLGFVELPVPQRTGGSKSPSSEKTKGKNPTSPTPRNGTPVANEATRSQSQPPIGSKALAKQQDVQKVLKEDARDLTSKHNENERKITTLETLQEGLWTNMMKLKDTISSAIEGTSASNSLQSTPPVDSSPSLKGPPQTKTIDKSPVRQQLGRNAMPKKQRAGRSAIAPQAAQKRQATEEEEYQMQLALALSLSLQEQGASDGAGAEGGSAEAPVTGGPEVNAGEEDQREASAGSTLNSNTPAESKGGSDSGSQSQIEPTIV